MLARGMRISVALLDSEDLARLTDGELLSALFYLRSVGETRRGYTAACTRS